MSASRGLAPREGLECLLVKMGRTGPLVEPRCGPQAGKSGDPCSQDAGNVILPNALLYSYELNTLDACWSPPGARPIVMACVTGTLRGAPCLDLSAPREPAW